MEQHWSLIGLPQAHGVSGTIPESYSALINLRSWGMAWHALSGSLPVTLASTLTQLDSWDVQGLRLSGTMPTHFGLLTSLSNWFVDGTLMSGTVSDITATCAPS